MDRNQNVSTLTTPGSRVYMNLIIFKRYTWHYSTSTRIVKHFRIICAKDLRNFG